MKVAIFAISFTGGFTKPAGQLFKKSAMPGFRVGNQSGAHKMNMQILIVPIQIFLQTIERVKEQKVVLVQSQRIGLRNVEVRKCDPKQLTFVTGLPLVGKIGCQGPGVNSLKATGKLILCQR
jgi:hypothetical protein